MSKNELGRVFGLTESSCSRLLTLSEHVLNRALRDMHDARIRWPEESQMADFAAMIHSREPNIDNVFGWMDGVNLPVQEPGCPSLQNALYNGWKSSTFVSAVCVWGPDGTAIYAKYNCPGSWHDKRITDALIQKLPSIMPSPMRLCTDSAWISKGNEAYFLYAPKEGEAGVSVYRRVFAADITSCRQPAEWGMRGWQGAFPRLTVPLSFDSYTRKITIENTLMLHNLRCRFIGINQIATVFAGDWEVSNIDVSYDRVAQFYDNVE
jgi:hypothetical protein